MCAFLVDEKGNISDVRATQEFDSAETPKPGVDYTPLVASHSAKVKAATESEKAEGEKSLNAEAGRIVKHMPQWTPATTKGKPANSYATVIIGFSLK